MGSTKKPALKENDIISASEIGQYHFCSVSWYLQKCGYEPKSPMLDIGLKKHKELGRVIDYTQSNIRKSRSLAILGYLLLVIGVLILFFEVIL